MMPNEIGKYKDIIKSIKNNRTMTTTKRNSALNVQKTIYRNKIIAMMKRTPPTATQDDLDQIK